MSLRNLRPDLRHRFRGDEILDEPDLDRNELARSLGRVARVNLALGGMRSLLQHLRPIVRGRSEVSMLDVGVGSGELSRRIARRLGRSGRRFRWIGVDLHPGALEIAHRRAGRGAGSSPDLALGLVRGDARHLPFRTDSFDVSIATLTLHHFEDPDCRRVLSEMARVSRTAVLVSDLERSALHYLGARLLSATWWRNDRITRHDGPVSVLRSFTKIELLALARAAPFRSAQVRRHFPFRLVLDARP